MAAALIGAVPAVAIGGFLAIVAAGFWAWRFPQLRGIDRFEDADERSARPQAQPADRAGAGRRMRTIGRRRSASAQEDRGAGQRRRDAVRELAPEREAPLRTWCVAAAKIVIRMPRPSEPPSCCATLSRPEAAPASRWRDARDARRPSAA